MYRLRELEKKDIAIINQWRNKKELIDYLGAPFRYINLDVDEQWYLQYILQMLNLMTQIKERFNPLFLFDNKFKFFCIYSFTNFISFLF